MRCNKNLDNLAYLRVLEGNYIINISIEIIIQLFYAQFHDGKLLLNNMPKTIELMTHRKGISVFGHSEENSIAFKNSPTTLELTGNPVNSRSG